MATSTRPDQATPAAPRRRWLWRCTFVLVLTVGLAAGVTRVSNENAGDGDVTADLAAARARAALRPCTASGSSGEGPVALRGLRAKCLGDGTTVDVGGALAGRPAMINVWASWCEPCRKELPVLDAYAASPGAVPVLGVLVLSAPEDGLELLAALEVHFPSIVDTQQAVMRTLRTSVHLPVSYLVTHDGKVRRIPPASPFRSADEVARTLRAMT